MRFFIITAAAIIAWGCTDRQMALIEGLVDKAVPGVIAPPVGAIQEPQVAPTPAPQLTSQGSPPPAAITEYAKVRIVFPAAKGGIGYKAIAEWTAGGGSQRREVALSENDGAGTLEAPIGVIVAFTAEGNGIAADVKFLNVTGDMTVTLDRYSIK